MSKWDVFWCCRALSRTLTSYATTCVLFVWALCPTCSVQTPREFDWRRPLSSAALCRWFTGGCLVPETQPISPIWTGPSCWYRWKISSCPFLRLGSLSWVQRFETIVTFVWRRSRTSPGLQRDAGACRRTGSGSSPPPPPFLIAEGERKPGKSASRGGGAYVHPASFNRIDSHQSYLPCFASQKCCMTVNNL